MAVRNPDGTYSLDSKLVAKCQKIAGARVHELAGIIQRYWIYHSLINKPPTGRVEASHVQQFNRAEVELRKFLVAQTKLNMIFANNHNIGMAV